MAIAGPQAEALYETFGPAIYRRCLKLLCNQAEAQDATQEVFVRACRHWESFAGDTPLPWLYQIASRHCLNKVRDSARHAATLDGLPFSAEADLGAALVDRHLARQVLARFDEETSLVAVYSLVDGMSQEEVARALGLSRKTVGVKLRRFLENARKYLVRTA